MNDDDVGPVLLDRRCGVVRRRGFGDDAIARLFQKEPNEVALERASIRDDGGRLRGLSSRDLFTGFDRDNLYRRLRALTQPPIRPSYFGRKHHVVARRSVGRSTSVELGRPGTRNALTVLDGPVGDCRKEIRADARKHDPRITHGRKPVRGSRIAAEAARSATPRDPAAGTPAKRRPEQGCTPQGMTERSRSRALGTESPSDSLALRRSGNP